MSPELAAPPTIGVRRGLRPRPLVVADVALFYGERSGGIRTYLDAKVRWADGREVEHHVIVPGRTERHEGVGRSRRHELPSLRLAASYGYRIPLGARALCRTLRAIKPDVVLQHDPFWRPLGATRTAQALGARVVAVHHGSSALNANAFPGPVGLYAWGFRHWLRHAYAPVDAVMSAADPGADAGRAAELTLRFGLHPAFRPQAGLVRGEHVLYVGRVGREKGLDILLEAAARSEEPWPLQVVGAGTADDAMAARVRRLGLGERVSFHPYEPSREALARRYAEARCVVMPGAYETFGLVGFEAAASGASAVACRTAPSARLMGELVETYVEHDADDLARAVARARAKRPDLAAAARFAERHTWERAFEAELADLRALAKP